MKKCLLGLMVLGLALLGFTGCSNGDSDNDAESNSLNSKADEILDLRIKKSSNSAAGDSRAMEYGFDSEVTETEHVKVRNVKGGIEFTIKMPDDDCYVYREDSDGGIGYVAIYDDTDWNKATCAELEGWKMAADEGLKVVYPLCNPGKKYSFRVQIEPKDVDTYKEYKYYERVTIVAEDGIGEIDYNNINKMNKYFKTSYKDGKLDVSLTNIIPPDINDVTPCIDVFAGNGDNDTLNANTWIGVYFGEPLTQIYNEPAEFSWNIDKVETYDSNKSSLIENLISESGKDQYYLEFYYKFNVPDSSEGIKDFRTAHFESNMDKIE